MNTFLTVEEAVDDDGANGDEDDNVVWVTTGATYMQRMDPRQCEASTFSGHKAMYSMHN